MVYELHVLEMLVQLQGDLLLGVWLQDEHDDLLPVEQPQDEQETQRDDPLHEVTSQEVLQPVVQVDEIQMVMVYQMQLTHVFRHQKVQMEIATLMDVQKLLKTNQMIMKSQIIL